MNCIQVINDQLSHAYFKNVFDQLKNAEPELFYIIRQYCISEIVDTFYRYEPIWNYRFLYKCVWILERYLSVIRNDGIINKKAAKSFMNNEKQEIDSESRTLVTYIAYASISIVVSDTELMNILISKRFRVFSADQFKSIVYVMQSIIQDPEIASIIPSITPYDIPDIDTKEVQLQFTKKEDVKHIFNIYNYLANSSLQLPFVSIFYSPATLQKAVLWLSLRYFSTNDSIAKQVALKSLTVNLPNNRSSDEYNEYKNKEQEIMEMLELIEMEMMKVTRIVSTKNTMENQTN